MITNSFKRFALASGVGMCLLYAANVKTDYDHSADFSRYKTYSILKIQATDSLWDERIAKALDTELSAKGWSKVPSGGDVSVAAFGSTKNEQSYNTFYDGLGGGWGWRRWGGGMGQTTTTVENTPVGTLNVDMFDAQTKKLIWRGSCSDVLSSKPEKNEKKLENAMNDLFKKFPPKERG